jgi:hypothetical protein
MSLTHNPKVEGSLASLPNTVSFLCLRVNKIAVINSSQKLGAKAAYCC